MNNWIAPNIELLPDFIIGGAMKSGTSTLHAILNRHPRIFIPPTEIGFFDIDNILQHSDFNFYQENKWVTQSMDKNPKLMWDWYQDKFRQGNTLLKGDYSTTYLASEIAAKRISMQNKEIKVLFVLRQPTLRAYSNYYHLLRTGRATYNFEDTIRYNPYPIINRSLYREQIENYYKHIPKSRIKIVIFEDFIKDTESTLREICEFLNLDYQEFPNDILKTHANKAKVPRHSALQAKKNLILRNFGNILYGNTLPFKSTHKNNSNSFMARVLNALHTKVNPQLSIRPPEINPETKLFLDNYFYTELEGINELLGIDVMSKWFPNGKI